MSRAEMVVHRAPMIPDGVTPCCGRQPRTLNEGRHTFTWQRGEVTCHGRSARRVPWGTLMVLFAFGWMLDESTVHTGPNWWGVLLGFAALACFAAYAATRR